VSNARKTRAGERKAGVADPVLVWADDERRQYRHRSLCPSTGIRRALEAREEQILDAVIRCPYPDHDDTNPSWRCDVRKKRAYCTCGSEPILGILMRIEAIDFDTAKVRATNVLGRSNLIPERRRKKVRGSGGSPPPDPNRLTAPPGCRFAEYAAAKAFIDVESGLAWLASMPPAEITTGRNRRPASPSGA
jgi:hypothetical protein